MKLLDCKTLLPTLVKFEDESGNEGLRIAFIDATSNEVYFAKPILATLEEQVPLKEQVLARYVRKPIEPPNMPENGWNR